MINSTGNGSKKEKIVVEIEKIQNATVIKDNYFFEKEIERAIELIDYIIKHKSSTKENNSDKQDEWFYQHNTIAVLGPRGIGKTSFILTLRDRIENINKDSKYEVYSELKNNIIWLPNLDPTRMEENETFLVTVVANILKIIKKSNTELDSNIREALQLLSRDFAVLVPARVHEERWKDLVDDPDSFAFNILNNAYSGISLAHSFHKFLGSIWIPDC